MRKVLFVSFLFPPTNSIAATRAGKLAKYLPDFGWEPLVLTADNVKWWPHTMPLEMPEQRVFRTPYFSLAWAVSQNTMSNVPAESERPAANRKRYSHTVLKRTALGLFRLPAFQMLFADPIGWYPSAVRKGCELISTYKIDAIFSSYAPSTSHLIASRLQRTTGLPWIAEFRDPWSHNHNVSRNGLSLQLEEKIERRVVKNASLLVAVSEPMAEQLEALHGKEAIVIHNGFDQADYVESVPPTQKFTITYTGNVDPGGRLNPTPLLEAIKELHLDGRLSPNDFELRFYGGRSLATIIPAIERFGLEGAVTVYGFVPFAECVRRQKESTALLLLKWNDPSRQGIYTGKVFEYLGALRPVIAVGSCSDAPLDELLTKSGMGVTPRTVGEIKALLSTWLEEFKRSGRIVSHFQPDVDFISRFTRTKQAQILAQALDGVSRER